MHKTSETKQYTLVSSCSWSSVKIAGQVKYLYHSFTKLVQVKVIWKKKYQNLKDI